MATLNSWQKITRVLSGRPFGDGKDGAYSSATVPTITYVGCSGTAAATTLTADASTLANGDIILIHQSRGTGVGQWEINMVISGGGTTTLTMARALKYTYGNSGASQAQAAVFKRYTTCTVSSGTWAPTAWNGNKGGILPLAVAGTFTATGGISIDGVDGNTGAGSAGGAGKGFVGGTAKPANGSQQAGYAYCGEGSAGAQALQTGANGSGGGGGYTTGFDGGAGGGGSHSTAGTAGTSLGNSTGGSGASTLTGSSDMTTMTFGGAGGGGARDGSGDVGSGAGGGGIIALMARNIVLTGTLTSDGGSGTTGVSYDAGGAGAGGSILLACQIATLGTDKMTAGGGTGGVGVGGSSHGGNGGDGRITVHHSGTISGSTSDPSFTDVTDTTLVESNPGLLEALI